MHICISGLTAAGKTTHSTLLAADLGLQYVSATDILAELCGLNRTPTLWLLHSEDVRRMRDALPLDLALDERLCSLADDPTPKVFDAWALPWIWKGGMVRVWLNSDVSSRSMKCQVSCLGVVEQPGRYFRELIITKDEDARRRFMELYHFDLFNDHKDFDVWIDNSAYIEEPTAESSTRGIAGFHPVFREVIASRYKE